MFKDKEIWKPIENFEGLYEISNHGRVKSTRKSLIRALTNNNRGYPSVSLYKDGAASGYLVHRLVAKAFVEGDQTLTVNHKDGNKANNHFSNLEWVSLSDNLKHAVENNLNPTWGETHHKARLTAELVLQLRKDWDGTSTFCNKIAEELGCHPNSILLAVTGKTWKSVEMPKGISARKPAGRETMTWVKLSDDDVIQVRKEYKALGCVAHYLSAKAKELDVCSTTLKHAVTGRTFKHLPMVESISVDGVDVEYLTSKYKKPGNYNSKLSDDTVIAARREYYSLEKTFGFIAKKAKELGVDRKTLQKAIVGETFKHIPLSATE